MSTESTHPQQESDWQELHAWIHGRVQGVGYRYFVVEQAPSLGVRGYVRNESDGSVEVLAQGSKAALERLLVLLRKGPPAAQVSNIRTTWGQPTEHLRGFTIRW